MFSAALRRPIRSDRSEFDVGTQEQHMTTSTAGAEPTAGPSATEYSDKIFTAVLGTMEAFSLYLGERLGWLDALASEPLTAA